MATEASESRVLCGIHYRIGVWTPSWWVCCENGNIFSISPSAAKKHSLALELTRFISAQVDTRKDNKTGS